MSIPRDLANMPTIVQDVKFRKFPTNGGRNLPVPARRRVELHTGHSSAVDDTDQLMRRNAGEAFLGRRFP
jgi:hypothetical protein